jgi:hypothetical protein
VEELKWLRKLFRFNRLAAENWWQKLESTASQGIETDALLLKYNGQKQK